MPTPEMPAAPAPAPVPAPAKKSNTLVIVLCVFLGLFLLILASCVGTCMYLGKKAKDYAKESKKNPQISALAMVAGFTPGVEVVSKDLDAGTIVLKNTKTGEIVKLDAKSFTQDKISSVLEKITKGKSTNDSSSSGSTTSTESNSAPAESNSSSSSSSEKMSDAQSAAIDGTLKTFRSDFPLYAGSDVTTLEAAQNGVAGVSSSLHVFETSDSPQKVVDFYVNKLTSDGYTVLGSENASNSNGPKLSRVMQKGGMGATINLEVLIQNGKTHASVNQIILKQ